mmetsp:Transcript_17053/g.40201  ORF Transcript_17053/g.40201 Transcript_17053/m.40201 type:complete len:264 (+) Transcript_17053:846-1637(+)
MKPRSEFHITSCSPVRDTGVRLRLSTVSAGTPRPPAGGGSSHPSPSGLGASGARSGCSSQTEPCSGSYTLRCTRRCASVGFSSGAARISSSRTVVTAPMCRRHAYPLVTGRSITSSPASTTGRIPQTATQRSGSSSAQRTLHASAGAAVRVMSWTTAGSSQAQGLTKSVVLASITAILVPELLTATLDTGSGVRHLPSRRKSGRLRHSVSPSPRPRATTVCVAENASRMSSAPSSMSSGTLAMSTTAAVTASNTVSVSKLLPE